MNAYLKIALLLCPLAGSAQTVVTSMQTTDNPDVLAMNVIGTRDGRPFRHSFRYETTGLTQPERDSLYRQSSRTLAALGIPMPKPYVPGTANTESENSVTITCATCIRKGDLEIYGTNSVHTRKLNDNRAGADVFPITVPLAPGDYRLVYKQRGQPTIEMPLTIAGGEKKQLTLP